MKRILQRLRSFSLNLGLVEQAQIVASTAVIVMMVTIIAANIALQKEFEVLDFISILTAGVIGYASVYFSLKYGRQLEEQRRELEALNTMAMVVSTSFNLNYIFANALHNVADILKTEYGWLYVLQGESLVLKKSYGTDAGFFAERMLSSRTFREWIEEIRTNKDTNRTEGTVFHLELQRLNIQSWVSVPLRVGEKTEGVLLLASISKEFFPERKVNLVAAFSNQISVALNNAHLFDKLAESEQRYADLFEHSPDMYHLVNRDGIIINCNQTEAQLLQYPKSEIIGRHLTFLYPPVMHAAITDLLRRSFDEASEERTSEETKGSDEQMQTAEGRIIDVSVKISPVKDENGRTVQLRCVARDMTEQRFLEQKVMQAQRIDSIGNLAGGIAHDFNNILTSIMGASSIMRRRLRPSNRHYPFVEIIETAATRGKALTNQLLTFARRTPVQFHPLNLHDILEETLRMFEPSVKPLIDVRKQYHDRPAVINGDEGQIQQALLNLFINARDAMPNGGTLSVATTVNTADQSVIVTVADNGVGMAPNVQKQIFEPFFSTKQQGKGTGLGLSVVYGVMKSHEGSVTFVSTPGNGTVFTLLFPMAKGIPADLFTPVTRAIVGGSESVLVVDDEEYIRLTLSTMLKDLGYTVTAAAGGKEAIELLATRKKFHVILLDMNMPQVNGMKVVERIRARRLRTKVIISSGYNDAIIEGSPLVKRIDGFLQKPYRVEELAKKVRDVLDAR